MSDSIKKSKADLRKLAKIIRRRVYSVNSEKIAQDKLIEYIHQKFPDSQCVAGYCPIQTEISPMDAMKKLDSWQYPICLPVVVGKNVSLKFRSWKVNEKLIKGEYGASIPNSGEWVIPRLIIVPLLAFDKTGYRLGYGGGYYDRTLEHLKKDNAVKAVGFAFSGQFCSEIPKDEYDHKLDTIITEQGITDFD